MILSFTLASRTILIDRIEFDAAILALDDARRAEGAEAQKRAADKKKQLTYH